MGLKLILGFIAHTLLVIFSFPIVDDYIKLSWDHYESGAPIWGTKHSDLTTSVALYFVLCEIGLTILLIRSIFIGLAKIIKRVDSLYS